MILTLKHSRIRYFATSLFFVFAFLLPQTLFAQEAVTLSVSPTIFDMTGTPGQTWSSTVRIINVNPFELTVSVEPANFEPKGEAGLPKFNPLTGDASEDGSFGKWITIEKEVKIGAEKTVEIPFTITVPEGASPGGHYAALMIKTKPSTDTNEPTNVQTAQVISSLIFLRVTGDVREYSTVRSFRTTSYILGSPEATFELRIENKGNVHVQPQGEIKIFNMWGQERGVIPINQKTLLGNVLPQSVRKFSFDWKGEWAVSDIGRYTAVATLAYGNDTRQFITADTAFWIIPWKFLLTAFVLVGGFVWLFVWGIKLYIRRMLTLAGIETGRHPSSQPEIVVMKAEKPKRGRPKSKKVSEVVAPLEVGILDLRSRLQNTKTYGAIFSAIVTFIKAYWKFFLVVTATIVFIIVLSWFVRGALTPSRDYEVTIEEGGKTVTVSKEELEQNSAQTENSDVDPATIKTLVPVALVNRSGDDTLLEEAKQTLKTAGFIVGDVSTDTGAPQDKTVVVYDSKNEKLALELSTLFDDALLSALTNNTASDEEIVIYLGSDIVKR